MDADTILDVGAETLLREKLNDCELLKESLDIKALAAFLSDYLADKKVIFLIGPEGAGKSTLVTSLGFASIDTDDFLLGTREWRKTVKDEREACDFVAMLDYADKIVALDTNESLQIPEYDGPTGLALAAPQPYKRQITGKVRNLVIGGCLNPFSGERWQTRDSTRKREPDISIYLYASDKDRYNARLQRDVTQKQRNISKEELLEQFNKRQATQLKAVILPELANADLVIVVAVSNKGNYTYNIYKQNV